VLEEIQPPGLSKYFGDNSYLIHKFIFSYSENVFLVIFCHLPCPGGGVFPVYLVDSYEWLCFVEIPRLTRLPGAHFLAVDHVHSVKGKGLALDKARHRKLVRTQSLAVVLLHPLLMLNRT
jgi:hypothetical protein